MKYSALEPFFNLMFIYTHAQTSLSSLSHFT